MLMIIIFIMTQFFERIIDIYSNFKLKATIYLQINFYFLMKENFIDTNFN